MVATPHMSPDSGTTVLLFGPQALSFSQESLKTLRTVLTESEDYQWILDTISELPSRWNTLMTTFPKLQEIPGEKLLHDLNSWLRTGDGEQATSQLPNILLTPLVVLTQLTQFSRYLSLSLSNASVQAQDLHTAFVQRNVETVGFCTGLLSASVVSSKMVLLQCVSPCLLVPWSMRRTLQTAYMADRNHSPLPGPHQPWRRN